MIIKIADHAGFCGGVKRAVKIAEEAVSFKGDTYSLGPIVHNKQQTEALEKKGLQVLEDYKEQETGNIVIRSHGAAKSVVEDMENRGFNVIDATCHVLLKIYEKIKEKEEEYQIVIIGDPEHPEIIGIAGQLEQKPIIVNTKDEAEKIKNQEKLYIISQTTNRMEKFLELSDIIDRSNAYVLIDNTICNATRNRQQATEELSKDVEAMITIGGLNSSNTNKLYEITKKHCKNTFRIETVDDLSLQEVLKFNTIGITAGASTPDWIIEEVVNVMDNYSKDFMEQVEDSITKIYPKDIVKGRVLYVRDNEVAVDIGYRSDGLIKHDEISSDESVKPQDLFKPEQEIEVYVIKMDDGEGNVVLSTRRVEGLKNWENLVDAYNANETVEAQVVREVKGGLLATVKGINAFIPGSQVTTHYVKDLSQYVGQTLECKIINVDDRKKRLVLSSRKIQEQEQQVKIDEAWENINVDETIKGTVQRLTDFGAFVDLGGVDGLIHISDISWKRIKHPSDVLNVGDEVEVIVLRANKERNRISLGLKQLTKKPFDEFVENNKEGDVVKGEVVNLLDFGAFVRLQEGVEGLVHVSQISYDHVEKPSDELEVGQELDVKILEINPENKRIALSIKGTQPEPQKPEKKAEPKKAPKKKVSYSEPVYEESDFNNSLGDLLDAKLSESDLLDSED
ncbi:bifunctional 4-hydroxy-3-methylbut-2-enyl diphosphate reductase/30S ribosomal protein S1 [Gallicola sp. Sow4_E12]|uniref:bifunctional 4-hydroxy-3-methylbut-2-enyl diphosphate reductase/30S ribosomal protein S1 n=1 Tax=Gallicola sp. Sow4_E12 TaxID=3438785 RepID=UPI003F92F6AF